MLNFKNFIVIQKTDIDGEDEQLGVPHVISIPYLRVTKSNDIYDSLAKYLPDIKIQKVEIKVVNHPNNTNGIEIDNQQKIIRAANNTYIVVKWLERKPPELSENSLLEERTKKKEYSIYDCFKYFSSSEQLGMGNEWLCPECNISNQATKKISLWSTPEYLIIHLKRYVTF